MKHVLELEISAHLSSFALKYKKNMVCLTNYLYIWDRALSQSPWSRFSCRDCSINLVPLTQMDWFMQCSLDAWETFSRSFWKAEFRETRQTLLLWGAPFIQAIKWCDVSASNVPESNTFLEEENLFLTLSRSYINRSLLHALCDPSLVLCAYTRRSAFSMPADHARSACCDCNTPHSIVSIHLQKIDF